MAMFQVADQRPGHWMSQILKISEFWTTPRNGPQAVQFQGETGLNLGRLALGALIFEIDVLAAESGGCKA